jgi:Tfp pilus assembly protein PilV
VWPAVILLIGCTAMASISLHTIRKHDAAHH